MKVKIEYKGIGNEVTGVTDDKEMRHVFLKYDGHRAPFEDAASGVKFETVIWYFDECNADCIAFNTKEGRVSSGDVIEALMCYAASKLTAGVALKITVTFTQNGGKDKKETVVVDVSPENVGKIREAYRVIEGRSDMGVFYKAAGAL